MRALRSASRCGTTCVSNLRESCQPLRQMCAVPRLVWVFSGYQRSTTSGVRACLCFSGYRKFSTRSGFQDTRSFSTRRQIQPEASLASRCFLRFVWPECSCPFGFPSKERLKPSKGRSPRWLAAPDPWPPAPTTTPRGIALHSPESR